MRLRSLGYKTDLIFASFDGEIIDRGTYLVVRTPSNPTFYWGNFLLFQDPPGPGDFQRWRDLFADEIGSPPLVSHQAFGWDLDGGEGDLRPFLDGGFSLSHNVVMATSNIRAPARPAEFASIRPLKSPEEWSQAIDNQVLCREPGHDEPGYRTFRKKQMDRYRRMVDAGLGDWYGAFVDGRLVADLGLFTDGTLGRYQTVGTHPDYRRQGIAGTLVYEAGRQAIERHGIATLVIVAEDSSGAARLYRSTGFEPLEAQWGLEWWKPGE